MTLGDEQLALTSQPGWQPDIQVSPVTSRTLTLNVAAVPAGLSLKARLYPLNTPAGAPIALVAASGVYSGTFNLPDPAFEGYVQVWVDEAEPRREAVIDYTLGGNPGHQRSGAASTQRRRPPALGQRTRDVGRRPGDPVRPGRDVTDRVVLHAAGHPAGIQPPPWATLVGQAYRLSATADAPTLAGTSLSFNYLGSEVPPGEENWLKLYFWNNPEWLPARGTSTVRWDLRSGVGSGGWGAVPTETIFPTVTGSKARFWLDNCNIEHGYIYEFEVFNDNQPSSPVNIALGANPLESDPGWGGDSYPWDIVDGHTFYTDTWAHGLAFTGGINQWMGQPGGYRQVTVDWGTPREFESCSRLALWRQSHPIRLWSRILERRELAATTYHA